MRFSFLHPVKTNLNFSYFNSLLAKKPRFHHGNPESSKILAANTESPQRREKKDGVSPMPL